MLNFIKTILHCKNYYLEDFNRKQRIKRESVREEDDAINIKNDYRKINYTDNRV